MENASKALLIAGAILILIILVSLLLVVRNNITSFNASQDELQMTADKAKFNEQFTRYNRDDVEGYELISLANKIVDYNQRESNAVTTNNSQAEPLKLSITLWDNSNSKITKDKVQNVLCAFNDALLFKSDDSVYRLIESDTKLMTQKTYNKNNFELKKIVNYIDTVKLNNPKIDMLTKKIYNIILKKASRDSSTEKWTFTNPTDDDRKNMLDALKCYRDTIGNQGKYKFANSEDEKDVNKVKIKYLLMLNDSYNADRMLKYYEYIQFTKAKFKCTKMDYSSTTGRVTNLEFFFTGEIE